MEEARVRTLNRLRPLVGSWQGQGAASYPTIATFEYREISEFAANDVQPVLRYEQRTWKKLETGEYAPSHWETGFWRVLPSGEIELACAQVGGRVEVLRGVLEPQGTGFALHLNSVLEANDPRVEKTARQFHFKGNVLQYAMQMSTTAVPDLTAHVDATLTRDEAASTTEFSA
jgi:hypothetical protein